MAKNQKAHDLAREIADRLSQRQSLAVSQDINANGHPLIRIGSASAGNAGALIRIQPLAWPLAVDVLGNAATIHVPLVAKIGFEANVTAGAGADVNSLAVICDCLGEVLVRGLRTEVYRTANGDNPDDADLDDASQLVKTWEPDPVFGMIAGQ